MAVQHFYFRGSQTAVEPTFEEEPDVAEEAAEAADS